MVKSIQQQNAERRLRHCRWEHEARGDFRALVFGVLAALLFIWIAAA